MSCEMKELHTEEEIRKATEALLDLRDSLDIFAKDKEIAFLQKSLNLAMDALGEMKHS